MSAISRLSTRAALSSLFLFFLFVPSSAEAAIGIVATTTNSNAGSTAISCTKPSGTASGDVVLAIINMNAAQNVTDNNGATPLVRDFRSVNYGTADISVWSRYAGGSEPASYAFTAAGSDRWAIECISLRGVDQTNKYDVTPSSSNFSYTGGAGGTTATSTAITTVTDNAFIITTAGVDTGVTTIPSTYPGDSFIKLMQRDTDQPLATSYKIKSPQGVQSSVNWTYGVTVLPGVTTFAMKPAADPVVNVTSQFRMLGGLLRILGGSFTIR